MPDTHTRIPTSSPNRGWSLETAIDYLLSMIASKHAELKILIDGNDLRYEQRFAAAQRAIDAAFAAQKEAMMTALVAQQEAVTKAERATEKRFESVNEFRGTLDNQQRTLIPRSEVQEIRKTLEVEITNLTKIIDEVKAKSNERTAERRGVQGGWGTAVGVVGFLLGLVLGILGLASRFMGQ